MIRVDMVHLVRRIAFLACLFACLSGIQIFAQELNLSPIGVVDMQVILETFPEESRPIESFAALRADYEEAMRSERRDLDEVTLEMLDAKLDGDDKEVERKQLEIQDRRENYRALSDFWLRRLNQAREKLAEDTFFGRFAKAVEFVAIGNKFSVIVEKGRLDSLFQSDDALFIEQKSLVTFADGQIDVTNLVVERIRTTD